MSEGSVVHSTFVIERDYPVSPERLYGAFSDPAKKRRWFVEGEGFIVEEFQMDFRVGGSERSRFKFGPGTPVPEGTACVNETRYQDIVPTRRIVLVYTMTIGNRCISSSQATFELQAGPGGTRLVFTEQAAFFEGADGPQIRERGWRDLLDRLALELAH
jgi:uncharacterized protein YndB with AHSA1/START domain